MTPDEFFTIKAKLDLLGIDVSKAEDVCVKLGNITLDLDHEEFRVYTPINNIYTELRSEEVNALIEGYIGKLNA